MSAVRAHRRDLRARLIAIAAVVVGLALLAGAIITLLANRGSTESFGGQAVEGLATSEPTPFTPSPITTRPGEMPAAAPAVVTPTRLAIPSIKVRATVEPVGVDPATGEFSVPPSVDVVGWYRFGPDLRTDAGSVVIAGHVDSKEQGRGAFFRLKELAGGDRIEVTGSDGTVRPYRVIAREEWRKTKIPLERYFTRTGSPRLTLITCGGPFDAQASSYLNNIVVTAVPA